MKSFATVDEYIEALNTASAEMETSSQEIAYNYKQAYDSAYEVLELMRDLFPDIDDHTSLYPPDSGVEDIQTPDIYPWFDGVTDELAEELYAKYDEVYDTYTDMQDKLDSAKELYDTIVDVFGKIQPAEESY